MATAVIVDAVRTPLGKRNGTLKDTHPVDLAAHTLRQLVERNDLDPALVEDVIMGCVMQVGDQGDQRRPQRRARRRLPRVGGRARRSTGSAARRSRRRTSPPRA